IRPEPAWRLWLGLACEAGDLPKDAAKEYEAVADKEPLAGVLAARAQLADGDVDGAIGRVEQAIGKLGGEGEPLGAAQALRGLAFERKKDENGAQRALDAAVAAGGPSGRAL